MVELFPANASSCCGAQTPKHKALRGSACCSPAPPRAQHRVLPALPCAAVPLVPSQGVRSIVPAPPPSPQLADPPLWGSQAQSQVYGGVTYYNTVQQQVQPKPSPPRRTSQPVTIKPPPPEVPSPPPVPSA